MVKSRAFLGTLGLLVASTAWAARRPGDPLKPGFNLFSKQDDVQIGQENAKQVLQQYDVVHNQFLQDYVQKMGQKLASAPEARASGFKFTFTVLNMDQVNAFALPGGPMFIYTGLLKSIDNEAQLAGVMGHEMSHVILRHGTHEATKANGISLLAGGIGSMLGGETLAGKLAQAGLGLGANSVILKFSRDAESEADALGSHLMAESGYDPIQMARFFEKLNSSGSQQLQILSDHPNPGNRDLAIQAEMKTLSSRQYGYETGDFSRVKKELAALPPPAKKIQNATITPGGSVPPPGGNDTDWKAYQGQGFAINYPRVWQAFGENNAADVTLAPRDGVVSQNGATQIGFGAAIGQFQPASASSDLRNATNGLIRKLKSENPEMNVTSGPESLTLRAGLPALTTTLHSTSAFGGNEIDTLVTVRRKEGIWYIVFIAPEKDQPRVENTFRQILDSVTFGSPK